MIPKKDERTKVKEFLNVFNKLTRSTPFHVEEDTDSPDRHFTTGRDFSLARNGRVVYVEAKNLKLLQKGYTPQRLHKLLRDSQQITKCSCLISGNDYMILIFDKDRDGAGVLHLNPFTPECKSFDSYEGLAKIFINYFAEYI